MPQVQHNQCHIVAALHRVSPVNVDWLGITGTPAARERALAIIIT